MEPQKQRHQPQPFDSVPISSTLPLDEATASMRQRVKSSDSMKISQRGSFTHHQQGGDEHKAIGQNVQQQQQIEQPTIRQSFELSSRQMAATQAATATTTTGLMRRKTSKEDAQSKRQTVLLRQATTSKDASVFQQKLLSTSEKEDLSADEQKQQKIEEMRTKVNNPSAGRMLDKQRTSVFIRHTNALKNRNKKGVLIILSEKFKDCFQHIKQKLSCSRCFSRKKTKRTQKTAATTTTDDAQTNSNAITRATSLRSKQNAGGGVIFNIDHPSKLGKVDSTTTNNESETLAPNSPNNSTSNKNKATANGNKADLLRAKMKQLNDPTAHLPKEQSQATKELAEMQEVIKAMSHQKLMEKAYRHLMDGLLYRTVRHDLDIEGDMQKFILSIWRIQNSSLWNDFLLFLGWMYILMSFFEPANRNDDSLEYNQFIIMVSIEASIIGLQTFDLAMEILSRMTKQKTNWVKAVFKHKKNVFRLLFLTFNLSDLVIYASQYPVNTMRFARIIRPLQIIIFSKSLRRNFQGIINSAKNLIMILIFNVIITFFWAYIGTNMIGDLYADPSVDTYAVDFQDFMKAANALYIFSSLDLYPDILFPAVQSSMYYLIYFLPFLVMFLLLFVPIPIAVVYEGFRKHRLNLLIADRIKRRKALWACFKCIVQDNKRSFIGKTDFMTFFKFAYEKVEFEEEADLISEVLWQELDTNENQKVSIEEFFNVIDITEQRSEFRLQRFKPLKWWIQFRQFIENKINLYVILTSSWFQMLSHVITLGSCFITIMGLFVDDDSDFVTYTDPIDLVFFGFFCLEIILKVIAYGPEEFRMDSWNMFDLTLVLFQIFFDYVFYEFMKGSNIKSLSASRVLKIAKLQKIFRMFRAFRTVKILRFVFSGLDIIHKVYEMLYKIVICVPIVMKLSVICVIVFYIYAAIGVELFSQNLQESYSSPYGSALCAPLTAATDYTYCQYANYNTFGGGILILLQVCVGAGWGYVQFDYGKRFNDLTLSIAYFNSFHFLSVFMLSLIGGLVWEVFDVVERIMRDQQAYDQQMELQRQWEEQQQLLEGSFQSSSFHHNNSSSNPESIKKSQGSSVMHRSSKLQSLRPSILASMKMPIKTQKMMSMSHHPNFDDEDDDDDDDDDKNDQFNGYNAIYDGSNHLHSPGELPAPPVLKGSTSLRKKSIFSKRVSINIGHELAFNTISHQQSNHNPSEQGSQQLLGASAAVSAKDLQDSNDSSIFSDDEDSDYSSEGITEEDDMESQQQSQQIIGSLGNLSEGNQYNHALRATSPHKTPKKYKKKAVSSQNLPQSNTSQQLIRTKSADRLDGEQQQKQLQQQDEDFTSAMASAAVVNAIRSGTNLEHAKSSKSLNSSQKKSKQHIQQRREAVDKLPNMLENPKCLVDSSNITQRDRGQLILYQDAFKMSTLDAFFVNREVPDVINSQVQSTLLLQQQQSSRSSSNMYEGIPGNAVDHQVGSANIGVSGGTGVAMSTLSHFHVINEEEEEEYEQNRSTTSHKILESRMVSQSIPKAQQQQKQKQLQKIPMSDQFRRKGSDSSHESGSEENTIQRRHSNSNDGGDKDDNEQDGHEALESEINSSRNNLKKRSVVSPKSLLYQESQFLTQEDEVVMAPSKLNGSGSRITYSTISNGKQIQLNENKIAVFSSSIAKTHALHNDDIADDMSAASDPSIIRSNSGIVNPAEGVSMHPIGRSDSSRNMSENNGLLLYGSGGIGGNSELIEDSTLKRSENPLLQNTNTMQVETPVQQKSRFSDLNDLPLLNHGRMSSMSSESSSSVYPLSRYLPAANRNVRDERSRKNLTPLAVKTSGGAGGQSKISLDIQEISPIIKKKDKKSTKSFDFAADEAKLNQEKQKKFANELKSPFSAVVLPTDNHHDADNNDDDDEADLVSQSNKQNGVVQKEASQQQYTYDDNEGEAHTAGNGYFKTQPNENSCDHENENENNNLETMSMFLEREMSQQIDKDPQQLQTDDVIIDFMQGETIGMLADEGADEQLLSQQQLQHKKESKDRRLERKAEKQRQREKVKKEVEMYYVSQLLDVEIQNGSLSQTQQQQNPLFMAAIMQSKRKAEGVPANPSSSSGQGNKSEFRSIERELIRDSPDNQMMLNHFINVNSDLRKKQDFQLKIDLGNMNYIINKAILKSVNQEKIHNIELRHFKQVYGSQFEDLLDDYIFPLWNQQAKLLFHLGNVLKFDNIPVERFIQLYCSLEMQISAIMMNKFSSFKLMFQDSDKTWFTINFVQESYLLQEVEPGGPWEYFDAMFKNKDAVKRLWKHRNIYQIQEQPAYIRRNVKRFFRVSQEISNNCSFHKLQMNQKRSDVIYIPLINDNPLAIQNKVLDIMSSVRSANAPEYITKDDLRIERIPIITKALAVVHLFDNPIMKDRKRTFNSEAINIEEAIVEEDMLQREAQNSTMNYTYSVEFIKDIRNTLQFHKEQLFTKFTQFYFHRICFERNFSNMQKVPFE